jgi:hypothetical protein
MWAVVVFPEPDSLTIAVVCPRRTVNDTSSAARSPPPRIRYSLDTPTTLSTGSSGSVVRSRTVVRDCAAATSRLV